MFRMRMRLFFSAFPEFLNFPFPPLRATDDPLKSRKGNRSERSNDVAIRQRNA